MDDSVISVDPSGYWDGADGSWSSFWVQVGTPGQTVRLLPGTSASSADCIWTVIDQGCTILNSHLSDCADRRGEIFHSNLSTTWSVQRLSNDGLYSLDSDAEQALGIGADAAYFGFDSVRLGLPGSTSPVLPNQLIAGMATNDFFVGFLGLSPVPANLSDPDSPIPSLLQSLHLRSASWAYTAGKVYSDPPVFGSLSFGGYDAAKTGDVSIQIPFYQNPRDLLVGLQAITTNAYGSTPLLTTGIYVFLNSLVADMWLPIQVCQQFEKALNISWNATAERYFVPDLTHKALVDQNLTFSFVLGSKSSKVTIDMPYAAFDHNLTDPYVNGTARYFPLKRAADSTQYTFGRVFFQEAYVIADYDRRVFNISQASTQGQQRLVSLSSETASFSRAIIAGIVVGAVLLLIAGSMLWWWCCRARARRSRWPSDNTIHAPEKEAEYELDDSMISEMPVHQAKLSSLAEKYELSMSEQKYELSVEDQKHELLVDEQHELSVNENKHELTATVRCIELADKRSQCYELAAW